MPPGSGYFSKDFYGARQPSKEPPFSSHLILNEVENCSICGKDRGKERLAEAREELEESQ